MFGHLSKRTQGQASGLLVYLKTNAEHMSAAFSSASFSVQSIPNQISQMSLGANVRFQRTSSKLLADSSHAVLFVIALAPAARHMLSALPPPCDGRVFRERGLLHFTYSFTPHLEFSGHHCRFDPVPTFSATIRLTATMASDMHDNTTDPFNPSPFTPMKNTFFSRPTSSSHNHSSPFSDYFTDDGRSPTPDDPVHTPSPDKRDLLARMNRLQAQIMRHNTVDSERDLLNIVGSKVGEIEDALNALHSQTRMPLDMDDSGLFMDEDEDEDDKEEQTRPKSSGSHKRAASGAGTSSKESQFTPEHRQAEHDFLILEAQQVLASLTQAQEQLRQQQEELHARTSEYESHSEELATLRTESDTLKADLGANYSELLFLHLQFHALETKLSETDEAAQSLESYAPQLRHDIQKAKREKIIQEMGRWRQDWEDVDSKMRKRNRDNIVSTAGNRDTPMEEDLPEDKEWSLHTVVRGSRGVDEIVIRRARKNQPVFGENLCEQDNEKEQLEDLQVTNSHKNGEELQQLEVDFGTGSSRRSPETASETTYANQSTQTPAFESEGDEDTRLSEQDTRDDYCAITTDSEDEASPHRDSYTINGMPNTSAAGYSSSSNAKTAWQDLWDGLQSWAGMGEERF